MLEVLKRLLVGRPLASTQMEEQRLPKTIALAVFSSDALSSTAYATEEILFVVAVGGSSLALGLSKLVPIAIVVAALLAIVIVSYRQVIFAYPNGGGAYVVSKENIGEMASLVAGASLMVDYVLTVAVSISAGVAAIISIPAFSGPARRIGSSSASVSSCSSRCMNMRGHQGVGTDLRHSDLPLHARCFGALIVYGLYRCYLRRHRPGALRRRARPTTSREVGGTLDALPAAEGVLVGRGRAHRRRGDLERRARVPAARVEERRRRRSSGWACCSARCSSASRCSRTDSQPYPSHDRTVIAQLGLQVFGNGPLFVLLQFATAAILVLAANTAYNGFPSLSSIIARDGYLPRQLANRGDRLVFSNGIFVLAGAAALLLRRVRRDHERADPALRRRRVHVVHALAVRDGAPPPPAARAGTGGAASCSTASGAVATLVVLLIVAVTKFTSGAWVPIVVIPAIVAAVQGDQAPLHGRRRAALACRPTTGRPGGGTPWSCCVEDVHAGALEALAYATSIAPDHLLAMTVVADGTRPEQIEKQWAEHGIDGAARDRPDTDRRVHRRDARLHRRGRTRVAQRRSSTCSSRSSSCEHWWEHLLHNQSTLDPQGSAAVPQEHRRSRRSRTAWSERLRRRFRGTVSLHSPSTSEWRNRQTR